MVDRVGPDLMSTEQTDEHEKKPTARWSALLNFTTRGHVPTLILASVLTTISGIITPALAILFGRIFEAFADYGAAVVILGCATWLANGSYFMAWMGFGALQAKEVRDRLFENLLHKDIEWYETHTSGIGALLPRLHTQIQDLQMATSQPLGHVAQNVISTVASLCLAFYYSWKLTLVIMSTVPVAFLVLAILSATMQKHITIQDEALTKAAKSANAAIKAIEVVKSFNAQEHEVSQYSNYIECASSAYRKQAQSNAIQMGFVRLFTLALFVQGFWYGNRLVAVGQINFSHVMTTFWACLLATRAFEDLLPHILVLEKGRAAGAALKALVDEAHKEPVSHIAGRKAPKYCDGDIEIRDISFAYPSRPDHLVLKTSTFFFPAGETTFIIGRSGSGKSTIGNLLMRFHEPNSGKISIDGNDIAELSLSWLRNNVTLVQQQSILFNETISRNIAFGKPQYSSATRDEIQNCIELAMLEETILHLPDGLNTKVGNTGAALSGGQRQRVAIARARLRNTPILILDESTSALDYISRTAVMEAIHKWRSGKTTIIITHDMSQIKDNNYVYVLDQGVIVQEGFRHHLIEQGSNICTNLADIKEVPEPFQAEAEPSKNTVAGGRPRARSIFLRHDSSNWLVNQIQSKRTSVLQMASLPSSRPSSFAFYNPAAPKSIAGRKQSESLVANTRTPLTGDSIPPSPLNAEPDSTQGHIPEYGISSSRKLRRVPSYQPETPNSSTLISKIGKMLHRGHDSKDNLDEKNASVTRVLTTIWPNLTPEYRLLLIFAILAALVNAAGPPIFAYVFSQLMTTFFHPGQDGHKALVYSLAILGVAVVDGLGCFCMHYFFESCGQRWVDSLRTEAMKRIMDQPKEWFDDPAMSVGSLTACLDRNADEMRNLLGRFVGLLLIAIAMVILAVIWSLIVCWKLTLVGIAAIPGLYAVTKIFEGVTSKWERIANDAAESTGAILVETFSDIRTVRALTLEGYFHKKYKTATSRTLNLGFKRAFFCGLFAGAAESTIHFATALIFWYGGQVVASGDFSINSVMVVFSMILFSTTNANSVLLFIPQISSSVETAVKLLRLSQLPLGKSHEYNGHLQLSGRSNLDISFNSLMFTYPTRPEALALDKLTLNIPSQRCTAIVGQSGSGKSTVASLLLRFYQPDNLLSHPNTKSSPLLISNHPITTLSTPVLRSLIAIVPQNPVLFPLSIAANITYGLPLSSPYHTLPSLHAASKAAGIHDFILTLPQEYNTLIGDGGLGLSGGQAQRIVIARALVRNPRILILDEATSALDRESGRAIQQTIQNLVGKRNSRSNSNRHAMTVDTTEPPPLPAMTVIVITHSREMMMVGDKIIVLKQGRCVEEGTFDELRREPEGELTRILHAEASQSF